ncbi:MAG: RluA family pseudouridine synthase [Kiritimatiellae bacterium]|nr:RluA family pseudouridine synthase [Kiritimatiellia bacterium]
MTERLAEEDYQRRAAVSVRPEEAGLTLLVLLSARFSYHDEAAWRRLIEAGRVWVDDVPVPPDTEVKAGQTVRYFPLSSDEPHVDDRFEVVLDDPDFFAVNKSGNLPCHPAGVYFAHTLWMALRRSGICANPIFVNRLDRETSGLVLIAKNPETAKALGLQFARHTVEKRYLVWVEGDFPQRVEADGFILQDPTSAVRKKRRFIPRAQMTDAYPASARAVTRFTLEAYRDGISRVRAVPETGRTHQIRATLHALGFPVVGDKLYGRDETCFLRQCEGCLTDADRALLRTEHQALHAAYLAFDHPRTGERITVTAPNPFGDRLP